MYIYILHALFSTYSIIYTPQLMCLCFLYGFRDASNTLPIGLRKAPSEPATRYLVLPATWYQMLGTRSQAPGTWFHVSIHGTRYQIPGTWCQVSGTRHQVPGTRYLVLGVSSAVYLVPGTWYEVPDCTLYQVSWYQVQVPGT